MKVIYLVVYYEYMDDEELTFDNAYENYEDAFEQSLKFDSSEVISINLIKNKRTKK